MKRSFAIVAFFLAAAAVSTLAHEQDTNAPRTRLEAFEVMTGTVIIKGTDEIGTVTGKNGYIIVKCVEFRDATSNQREFGMIITVRQNEALEDTSTVDYDELDALLRGIEYISKADPTVSQLDHFEAAFNTKGGLRVASYSSRRSSTVEATVTSNRFYRSRSWLNMAQLMQFKILVEQAQSKLESLRKMK